MGKEGAAAKVTKLERLLKLLSAPDSTRDIKNAAAEQIARLIPVHQSQSVLNVLNRLKQLLYDKKWDVRCAGAHCLEILSSRCELELRRATGENASSSSSGLPLRATSESCLSFEDLDLDKVLRVGKPLLANSGKEYDVEEYGANLTDEERLKEARLRLDKNIGLDKNIFDSTELVSNQELMASLVKREEIERDTIDVDALMPRTKRRKTSKENGSAKPSKHKEEDVKEERELTVLECFEICSRDFGSHLFDEHWDVRHGAALGLRALLCTFASALFSSQQSKSSSSAGGGGGGNENTWHVDFAVRLICVLALDRLGDFFSERTTAPVKETSAQALGFLVRFLSEESVYRITKFLAKLIREKEWHIQHGGLLGFKYVLLSAPSMKTVGDEVIDLFGGLISTKSDDDVFCSAVENLILLIERMTVTKFPAHLLQRIHEKIWTVLPQLDEFHASISNCLSILRMVCGMEEVRVDLTLDKKLKILTRLVCHPSTTVRLAAISTYSAVLHALVQEVAGAGQEFWSGQCVFWFELLVIEHDVRVIKEVCVLFQSIVKESGLAGSRRIQACDDDLDHMIKLAVLPDHSQLTPSHLRHYESLQMTNVLLGSEAAGKGKKGAKKSAEAKLTFGSSSGPTVRAAINVRVDVARCLSLLLCTESGNALLLTKVQRLLETKSYLCQLVAYIVMSWAFEEGPPSLHSQFTGLISPRVQITYKGLSLGEVGSTFQEFDALAKTARTAISNIQLSATFGDPLKLPLKALLEEVTGLVSQEDAKKSKNESASPGLHTAYAAIDALEAQAASATMRLRTEAAACAILSKNIPQKLNFVIQPLMESVRMERDAIYQRRCGSILAKLIYHCRDRTPSPNAKLVKNLCARSTLNIHSAPSKELVLNVLGDRCYLENHPDSVVRVGATAALEEVVKLFGPSVFESLPMLKSKATSPLAEIHATQDYSESDLLQNLSLLGALGYRGEEVLSIISRPLSGLLGNISKCVIMENEKISHVALRVMDKISEINLKGVLKILFFNLLPLLQGHGPACKGVLGLIGMLGKTHKTGLADVIPYMLVNVMPLLNSHDVEVRQMAAGTFSTIFPTFATCGDQCKDLPPYLEGCSVNVQEAVALQKIFNAAEIEHFQVPFALDVQLRTYQQEGLNWLHFLQRFGMNGVLADDMGLGKTLQTLLILASVLKLSGPETDPKCIIVAPSTLVSHWLHEMSKYLPKNLIKALKYVGKDRDQLRAKVSSCNCVITSYDVVRKDIDWLSGLAFKYCVLDEGHLIKNANSTLSKACKRLKSEHRLILTGTPVQNDVLEIWSLFDFLMPGFLGERKDFHKKYRVGVNAGKRALNSKKDRDASILVADQLHKQISPFILRRTKDMVLKDLPSKIIQDIFLDMSPLQRKVYDKFSHDVSNCLQVQEGPEPQQQGQFTHRIQNLAKACTHPILAIQEMDKAALRDLGLSENSRDYADIAHSPKLVALQEVLHQCGILAEDGGDPSEDNEGTLGSPESPNHQILVFAQTKRTLDIIEDYLLTPRKVSFLRLDGSVDGDRRHQIAMQFQTDPTIPVLLLTTRVGGLGLNLTAADTVFFVEHDWNPMMDLQAMDRAHRLGQKKTVNVFRAIVKETYEERLMSMQRFKIGVAQTVVSMENASVKTLNANQFVDLFSDAVKKPGAGAGAGAGGARPKSVVEELEKNWEELYGGQYDDDFSVDKFASKM